MAHSLNAVEAIDKDQLVETIDPKVAADAERRSNENRQYIDFLFRQIGTTTFRYNYFFENHLNALTLALFEAEQLKTNLMKAAAALKKKKKKGSIQTELKINSFKTINDLAQLCQTSNRPEEAKQLFYFLSFFGKLRGLLLIANNFLKFLKKSYPNDTENFSNVTYYYNYWNGFTLRMYDYEQLTYPKNQLSASLSEQDIAYIKWPLAVRTSLYCACQFIKSSADLTNVLMLDTNWSAIQKLTYPEEFVCMVNMDEYFYKREARRASMAAKIQMFKMMGMSTNTLALVPEPIGKAPVVDPDLLKYAIPITFDTILLKFPIDLPVEPKKQKKNKKKK